MAMIVDTLLTTTTIPSSSVGMSTAIDLLLTSLSIVQGTMQAVQKKNHGHRHRYADINAVLETALPLLSQNGLCVTQHPHTDEHGTQRLMTILGHSSGQWIASSMKIIHDPQDIQSLGGSITYQRRYALVSILGIEQEDDDGNYAKDKHISKAVAQKDVFPRHVPAVISPANLVALKQVVADRFIHPQEGIDWIKLLCKVDSLEKLTEEQYKQIIKEI